MADQNARPPALSEISGLHSAGASPTHTRLILVRHGETEGNVNQVWHGALDAPLTLRGRAQVAATATRMAELHERLAIDHLYVSPLPRAQSTAAAIAAAIGHTPEVVDDLREFSIGDWEGRAFTDLRDTEDLWGRWNDDPHFAPPNGESPSSFNSRVVETAHALVAQHPDQTLVAVTHGAVIGNLLASFVGDGPGDWRRFDPPNCAISILDWDGTTWTPIWVNDIEHLPASAQADYISDY